ncbi:MAG: sulfatase-like hydrolase/transferase, partial [Verrucomicrobiota bacterium]
MRHFALFCLSLAILSTAEGRPRPNILFLLADDMRPDAIGALGNPHIHTPILDKLVAKGLAFSRATCSYPICVVSRAEILTGRHGWENGIDGVRRGGFPPEQTFWAEAFREAGYETWHVGKWHVTGRPSDRGYTRSEGLFGGGGGQFWEEGQVDWKGFPITGYRGWVFQSENGKEKFPELGVGVTPEISRHFADATIDLIESATDRPWMAHVNFTAPHDPLFVPPGFEGRYDASRLPLPTDYLPFHPFDHGNFDGRDEALLAWPRSEEAVRDLLRVYYSVIEDMDKQIGRILARLESTGQSENTIIIFTSDHGMACGSHGLRGKQNQYEHTINVPLIMKGPGIATDKKTKAQVYLRELFPTTCELAGIRIPDTVSADSFAPVVRSGSTDH